ncbi:hypothetical protein NHP21005_19100 (plasmid) [Helicobacter sp. NHP21005]|uniref:replication initiation protein n=1 Tax=Helicobacter felistomachi TaxID=3040201 RepID=UPI003369EAB5|nr:hypothetical protein NHP21005_19100 [Helicobacter sp. NHP21005]
MQLKTFMSLRSKYAKALYRLLVRFEDVKKHCMCEVLTYKSDFEGFKEFMGVSKSMQICMIEERVLKPACRELGVPINEGYNPENPDRSLPYETIFYTKIKKARAIKLWASLSTSCHIRTLICKKLFSNATHKTALKTPWRKSKKKRKRNKKRKLEKR